MMKVALGALLWPAVLSRTIDIDTIIPPFHDVSEFPEPFPGWGKLNSTFGTALDVLSQEGSNADLPFLPCITQPKVTMTDGTEIYTMLVRPSGLLHGCNHKRPAMLIRSPYGPTSRSIALLFALHGFVAVMQDQRGTFGSKGTFDMWQLGMQDGVDSMDWITRQPWSNGEVYVAGVSADGIATLTPLLSKSILPVKGMWTTWATGDGHDLSYPGGALRKDLLEGYMGAMSIPTRGASKNIVIPLIKEHELFGPWWYNLTDCRDIHNKSAAPGCHYDAVHWPAVLNAGWWDIFMMTELRMINGLLAAGDQAWVDKHVVIIDPLGHCSLTPFHGEGFVESATLEAETARGVVVGFFAALKAFSKQAQLAVPDVATGHKRLNFLIMGNYEADTKSPRNYWTSLHTWPVYTNKDFYMQGSTGTTGILSETGSTDTTSMSYKYDPSTKEGITPIKGGNNLPFIGAIHDCGTADQTSRDARDDVLVFDSEVLADDMAVVGNITARIFVGSDAVDTDFVAIVSDVGPKKAMMVRYGIVRMRHRDSDTIVSPPLTAGKVYEVNVDLVATAYIFPKGHRVRVTISSAAYPFYDANMNDGSPESSNSSHAVAANNVFHMGPKYLSKISMPVVKTEDIPRNRLFGASFPDPVGIASALRETIVV